MAVIVVLLSLLLDWVNLGRSLCSISAVTCCYSWEAIVLFPFLLQLSYLLLLIFYEDQKHPSFYVHEIEVHAMAISWGLASPAWLLGTHRLGFHPRSTQVQGSAFYLTSSPADFSTCYNLRSPHIEWMGTEWTALGHRLGGNKRAPQLRCFY